MKIKLDIDMLHFVFIYESLKNNLENDDPFKRAMLKEAYDYVANELAEQYTDEHGQYLEIRSLVKKALLNKS
tara:strand:+ start:298 stop:513 length:216 start_codon:yes stop_codon:yes gene_type:complete